MDELLKIRDVGVVNPVGEFHPDIPAAIVLLMGLLGDSFFPGHF